MPRTPRQLREDLLAVWNAGLDGVRVDRLVRKAVSLKSDVGIDIGGIVYPFDKIDRIMVVGGGKASGAMAESLEDLLEPLFDRLEITGWVNVPDDCAKPLKKIHLHPARPMGTNEPTEAAAFGTNEIIRLLETLSPRDLCLNLLSGGGSALLPSPIPEITLEDKLELTRFLSESGATIQELNSVRKKFSRFKGGGMKALCRGKRLISLILSDVLGDPLDVIASGPTVDNPDSDADVLRVLRKFADASTDVSREKGTTSSGRRSAVEKMIRHLENKARPAHSAATAGEEDATTVYDDRGGFVRNLIIGNNAVAVEAAGEEALRRGYSCAMHVSLQSEGLAEDVGIHLARLADDMLRRGPDALIHGGEPVVRLVPAEIRGKGGRNQQLVLAALIDLLERFDEKEPVGIALLSGGTDGEDGPTDAAGAWIDPLFFEEFRVKENEEGGCDPRDFLSRNDAYRFFEPFGTLIKTGATGTNVCDLRIVLVDRIAEQ